MAFSSINHIGWILCRLLVRINLWIIYFIIYFFLNFLIINILNKNNFFFLNQIFSTKINPIIYFIFSVNILSLGGLPPLLGFLPKWLLIVFIRTNYANFIILLIIIITIVTLRFYINITLRAFIVNYSKIKWFNNYVSIYHIIITTTLTLLSTLRLIFISTINFRF